MYLCSVIYNFFVSRSKNHSSFLYLRLDNPISASYFSNFPLFFSSLFFYSEVCIFDYTRVCCIDWAVFLPLISRRWTIDTLNIAHQSLEKLHCANISIITVKKFRWCVKSVEERSKQGCKSAKMITINFKHMSLRLLNE